MNHPIKIYKNNYTELPERFIRKIESDITYILSMEIPQLKYVYLFGSCARGDLRSSSDVDLVILTRQRLEDRVLASTIRSTLAEPVNGVNTDVVFMNEKSIKENTAFKRAVNKNKKIILEVLE